MNILIGITGGIAAYKSIEVARLLQKKGHHVRFALTDTAQAFITPLTLQAISGFPVSHHSLDSHSDMAMEHIELARWADTLLICPATANTIAKLTHGIADNLLTTLYLATEADIVIAPAMNRLMWQHPATQANLAVLKERPHHTVLPVAAGRQACGEIGAGRLLEPEDIVAFLCPQQDFSGIRIVITAGPTQEAIDPVRYLSNRSSGKMGYALAQAAAERGAEVTLISGPVHLSTPNKVTRIDVVSAEQMYRVALEQAAHSHIFIAAAAVSDYRIAHPFTQKHKKTVDGALTLTLIENPDIVAAVAALPEPERPYTIGFAAETEHLLEYARTKRQHKYLDLIIANDVSQGVFGSDQNCVTIIDADSEATLPEQSKRQLADAILDHVHTKLKQEPSHD